MKKIENVIEKKIRPALRAHGGDIAILEVTTEGLVKVKLTGACSSCPGAHQTLSQMVEVVLKEECPEVTRVMAVQQVSDELIDAALKLLRKDKHS